MGTYFQYVVQLFQQGLFPVVQLIFSQSQGTVLGHSANRFVMVQHILQHIECGIPSGRHVMRHVCDFEPHLSKGVLPRRQQLGGGMYEFECEFSDLPVCQNSVLDKVRK